ncbi:hypothetical protein [Fuchsiella alkaliacetigena]|uniref:hypothetical protein n=1 Tax=Fuchsiella alkaliacetigena TaxID=957042 RepID=UPI00200A2CC3|nr:hypothetical protein [Fuchsiella alkaliacetigena]MCK8824301.1 hypothetical protein [Fuchsiella alkaliacetigena]
MAFEIKKQRYNSKIKLYFSSKPNKQLQEDIITFLSSDYNLPPDGFELIKKSQRRGRIIFRYNSGIEVYYIKILLSNKFRKKIENLISPEGLRYFKISKKLLAARVPIVQPMLAMTFHKSLLRVDGVFVTKEFKGISMRDYFKQNSLADFDRELGLDIIKCLARIWANIVNNDFLHQDPTPSNFMINIAQQGFKLSLVDVDDIYPLPFLPHKLVLHSLARFSRKFFSSLIRTKNEEFIGQQERYIFFKEFLAHYKRDIDFKKFVRDVNQLTIKKLVKRDYEDYILQSDIMKDIYSRSKHK